MAKRVCPYFVGYCLVNPLRRLIHNPDKTRALRRGGMTVLDVGPGMGFFSIPMAEMVGSGGMVVCADVQERMLRALQRRAEAARLDDRIVLRFAGLILCASKISREIDFRLPSPWCTRSTTFRSSLPSCPPC
jgi:predicted RNA methylase